MRWLSSSAAVLDPEIAQHSSPQARVARSYLLRAAAGIKLDVGRDRALFEEADTIRQRCQGDAEADQVSTGSEK